jgi:hypothetical protein
MRFIEISVGGSREIMNLDHIIRVVPQHEGGAVIFLSDKEIVPIAQPDYEALQRSLGAFKI